MYAVLNAFAVRQRGNIALRMAIGATAQDVRRWMLSKVLARAACGLALGFLLSYPFCRLFSHYLFDTSPDSLAPRLMATVMIVAIVLMASWRPAQRAGRTSPFAVLKEA